MSTLRFNVTLLWCWFRFERSIGKSILDSARIAWREVMAPLPF